MVKDKPITTTSELVAALEKAGFATKADLKNFATKDDVREIVGAEIDNRKLATKDDLQNELKGLERRLKRRMGAQHNDIKQRIAQVAVDSATADDLKKLKEKVESYHTSSTS